MGTTSAGDIFVLPGDKVTFETYDANISKGDVLQIASEAIYNHDYLVAVKKITEADQTAIGIALETVREAGKPIAVLVGAPIAYCYATDATVGDYLVGDAASAGMLKPLSKTSTGVQSIIGIALKSTSGCELCPVLLFQGIQCGGQMT
jgi:ethanolamine utilization microcompartment shell protein EutL